jgi:hypothetical protein
MTPAALNSTACQREYGYAADLGKPILPILLSDGVSTNLLPPALSVIQFVDYRKRDDQRSALQLAKALWTIPAAKPLPNPLPSPPAVPLSMTSVPSSRVGAVQQTTDVQRLSWIHRTFLLFAPSTAMGWGLHLAFYLILLFGAFAALGLAIEPYDPKTSENLLAYGLLGLTLIVALPGMLLQRAAIRIRQRDDHRRASAEHRDLFQRQPSRIA